MPLSANHKEQKKKRKDWKTNLNQHVLEDSKRKTLNMMYVFASFIPSRVKIKHVSKLINFKMNPYSF